MARYMARNVVAAGLARRCEVQLSYGIGEVQPLAVSVQTFGTGEMADAEIERAIERLVDLTTRDHRGDVRPARASGAARGEFYRTLAAYGHFGRTDLDAPWEREDLVAALRTAGPAG